MKISWLLKENGAVRSTLGGRIGVKLSVRSAEVDGKNGESHD